ncbi:helix-turn-helix transcriptional regulator [Methylorubrum zatmanii]
MGRPLHASTDRKASAEPARLIIEPRRGLNRVEAARYIGVSPTKYDELVRDGRMPRPKRIDGCVRWDIRQLDAAWDALDGGDGESNEWD